MAPQRGSGGAAHSVSTKHALIMDEVDGMAGTEDRGGIQVRRACIFAVLLFIFIFFIQRTNCHVVTFIVIKACC